jgi:class 3 adenylate cyclase
MQFNIAHKIFGVAFVGLVLMAAVASYSIRLTAGISEDLHRIAEVNLPTTDTIEQINIRILEQGILLQRLFALEAEEAAPVVLQRNDARFALLGDEITVEFSEALAALKIQNHPGLLAGMASVLTRYEHFQAQGEKLVAARAGNDPVEFSRLLVELNGHQDLLNSEIDLLRLQVQQLSEAAVSRADRDERNLLLVNSILTALAILLSLLFTSIVARGLVQNVRNLVNGTEAVEKGDLDVEVEIQSQDEVGKLTGSFNHMVGELRLKERIKETFGKYIDPRIVSNLLAEPDFSTPGGERREMTVLFVDLKGFTSISEVLDPNELVSMINSFFSHMSEAISANNGVVDKYMGDAVMAYWGPPFCSAEEHATLACKAALQAQAHLEMFRKDVRRQLGKVADDLDFDLRIGISTGVVIVGTVGSKVSMNYTVMGDPVNLGSRLEGASKIYGTKILMSERTAGLAKDHFVAREIDLIRVKGKSQPTRIFELLGETQSPLLLPSAALLHFQAGMENYRQQIWPKAIAEFSAGLEVLPDDAPSQTYLARIKQLMVSPPPRDWDGVWDFDGK